MKKIFNILLGISILLLASCQQDEFDAQTQPTDSENVRVEFSTSMNTNISTSTGYEPMGATRNSAADSITLKPRIKYYILKDVEEDYYIVERVGESNIEAPKGKTYGSIAIDGLRPYKALSVDIRPGKYKIIVFTGAVSVNWNTSLIEGMQIPKKGSGEKIPHACRYMNIDFWTFRGEKGLQEEVFYGEEDFEIKKTDNLHSYPNTHYVEIGLERRVSKFRVLLKDVPSPNGKNKFANGSPIAILIKADVVHKENEPLPDGLDIWGDLWYNDTNPLMNYKFTTMTASNTHTGTDNSAYYISLVSSTSYAPYFFSDPQTEVPITISNFECTSRDTDVPYVYYGAHEFILKNNNITGLVLKPTDDETYRPSNNGPERCIVAEPVLDAGNNLVDPLGLFDANYEHNY